MSLRQFAERRQRTNVVELVAEVSHQRDDQGALVERVEDFECANQLQAFHAGALVRRHRRPCQRERCKPETCACKLPVIGSRRARRRLVLGARLIRPASSFRCPSEPVMSTRQRRRMATHVPDAGEVRSRGGRIIEKTQRDPARHEMALDARVFFGRLGPLRHHAIGRAGVAHVEQLARHDAPFDPPFLAIGDLLGVAGRGQQHLRRLGDLVFVAQNVRVREQIARILACFRRHGVKQLLGIVALAVERDTRLRDCSLGPPEPARGSRCGFVVGGKQPLLHARLVIGAAQELGIDLK